MKIATYNVNSIRIRLDTIISWVEKHKPDVLCIQETKCQDELFPVLILRSTGYQVHYRGMKSYNGVALLTREEPEQVPPVSTRSEEHTSELQSRLHLVCRLL